MRLRRVSTCLLSASCLSMPAAAAGPAAKSSGYALTGRFAVGGDGGWDYVAFDEGKNRLFVSRATHVVVLDADSGKVVGDIPDTPGVHGIALAPGLNRGFTSNGRAGTVTVFELSTLKSLGTWKATGENPDAILFEPVTKRLFTFNGRGRNATLFDASSGETLATIPLDGKPEFAVSDPEGRVFVNLEDKSQVAVLDVKTPAVKARWPLAPCEEPTGLAIDAKGEHLFVGCSNRLLAVVDTAKGAVVAKVPIGEGNDAVMFDRGKGLVAASNGDGTLTLVRETSPASWEVAQTVTTQRGARTLALDPKTHRFFLPTARFGPPPSPTADQPKPRPSIVPGSFEILVVSPP